MKSDNAVREAIDESLSGVRFNVQDMRSVLRTVRAQEEEEEDPRPARRRKKRLDFAFALMLMAVIIAPATLFIARPKALNSIHSIVATIGGATPDPLANFPTASPRGDPILDVSAESEAIRIARACFNAQCDTSVFSFEEYTVNVTTSTAADGATRYTVVMNSIYDNGCCFTVIVASPSGEVLQYSTPQLATQPTFFDSSSAEVRSWYDKYGPYLFTWTAQAQAEFSRRYEGATLRMPKDGEVSFERAAELAASAVRGNFEGWNALGTIYTYPTLYAERASADGIARYVVYCFTQNAGESLSDPCVLVTLYASNGVVESIRQQSVTELEQMM